MLKRDTTIDSIRGIAILLVLLHHISMRSIKNYSDPVAKLIKIAFTPFIIGGWTAVDLFFVLSGFLVSGLLFKEYQSHGRVDIQRFLLRRGLKIYPGFYFFLGTSLLINIISYRYFAGTRPYFKGYMFDALFLHNYFGGIYVTTWSLDVEEAFYLLLSLFIFLMLTLKAPKKQTVIITYVILLIIGIAGRIFANIHFLNYNFDKQFSQTHFRLDALFFGVVLSYLYHFDNALMINKMKNYSSILLIICVILILPNFIFYREQHNWISIIMLALNPPVFGVLLLLAIIYKPMVLEENRWLKFLGVNSYAIYLWHSFINYYLINNMMLDKSLIIFLSYILFYLMSSIILGAICTQIVEKPILYFRDQYLGNSQVRPIRK